MDQFLSIFNIVPTSIWLTIAVAGIVFVIFSIGRRVSRSSKLTSAFNNGNLNTHYNVSRSSKLTSAFNDSNIKNNKWTKVIPELNNVYMVVSAILILGVDSIILFSIPALIPFFIAMLAVSLIFLLFFFYENKILKKKFATSYSKLDSWFVVLVGIRNIIFVLSFIPFVQVLGLLILLVGGLPYLLIYSLMLFVRHKSIPTV